VGAGAHERAGRAVAQEQWLLIKHRDESADPDIDPTDAYQTSVRSGRSMDEIAEGERKRRA
jgi:bifunctional non-homologous end joining protein LigD